MDPLTISTGIITILQATSAIISVCYNFRAALKNAPWSLTSLIDELKSLRNILESLEELSQGLYKPSSAGKRYVFESISNPDNGPLVICLRELSFLDAKIKSSCHVGQNLTRRKAALQALGWQLKEKDAKECLERIERCKNTLALALIADEATLLVEIKDLTLSLKTTALDTNCTIMTIAKYFQTKAFDDVYREIVSWLSSVDQCENHEAAISAHHDGTCTWVLESEEFTRWNEEMSSFLWLSGFAGVGKTIIFSRIVAHLTKNHNTTRDTVGIAYFYCDFTKKESQKAINIIGSLVAQLCSQFGCPEELTLDFKNSSAPGQRKPPSWRILKQTLLLFARYRKILILIDGLDECEKREDFLEFIVNLQEDHANISILITSRDEVDIGSEFESFSRLRIEKYRSKVDGDIESYIDKRLDADPRLKALSQSLKTDIKLSLCEKCAGMFRWAQCQLDALSRSRTTRAIRRKLSQLPEGLSETYAVILQRASQEDGEILHRVLLWVAFAVLPLTIEELYEAIAVEAGIEDLDEIEESRLNNPKDILSLSSSLLSVSEKGHVKLAHFSVKNYLLSTDIKMNPLISRFSMSSEEANQKLAIGCLTYLSLNDLASGPCVTSEDWEKRLVSQPLLKHVAKGWPYYFRAANLSTDLENLVSNFFAVESRQIFMSWIQILNSNWIFEWNEYPRHATPLYYAASFGLGDIVENLIKSKVDLNAPGSRFGGTALHGATLREHIPIMMSLLQAGADPSRADFNLITPLHTAVRIGNSQVIKLLLRFGASKDLADKLGQTPRDWAIMAKQVVSQQLLREETCKALDESSNTNHEQVYSRPKAFFPAMAIGQGLSLPLSMEKT